MLLQVTLDQRGFALPTGSHQSIRLVETLLFVMLSSYWREFKPLGSVDFTSRSRSHYSFNTCSFLFMCQCHLPARDIWYKLCWFEGRREKGTQTHSWRHRHTHTHAVKDGALSSYTSRRRAGWSTVQQAVKEPQHYQLLELVELCRHTCIIKKKKKSFNWLHGLVLFASAHLSCSTSLPGSLQTSRTWPRAHTHPSSPSTARSKLTSTRSKSSLKMSSAHPSESFLTPVAALWHN